MTVRFREREIPGLLDELRERAREAEEAIMRGTDLERVDRTPPEELLGAARHLMEQVTVAEREREGDRVVVTGPTWLFGTAIVCAAIAATDRFYGILHHFVDTTEGDPAELREALAAVSAWCETLMGYEHAETFGVED